MMTFGQLSLYFEKLEKTSSRLILIDILAELFSKVQLIEIGKVAYLIQGRVAPFFEPLEIGMSEKLIAQSIARAFGVDREEVLKEYGKVGDLGLVALQQSVKCKVQSAKLGVAEVFDKLRDIAKFTGEGTVERKVSGLVDLLTKASGIEAKHLVRIPLGTSRLGIGDPTVLDAFAKLKLGDRSKRKELEGSYNKVSDLGLIGETLWEKGLEGVKKLDVTVGRPIRSQLAERLPDAKTILQKFGGKAHVQFKYDGFRCVTGYTAPYIKGKGITSVRDLQVGDLVLTHKGRFQKVLAKQKRTIKKGERLFKFQTYLGDEIGISEGHPLLCIEHGKQVWKEVEFIKPGDEVIFPLPKFPPNNPHLAPIRLELSTLSGYKKTFILNCDFYRFLGFWIGDGFTNNFHNTERVGLLFNGKTEVDLANDYKKIIANTLHVPKMTVSRTSAKGCVTLYWRDEPLRHWLSTYFRRDWEGKMLPEWFSHVSKENFEKFLQGWIESDGSIDKDGIAKIVTRERDLASFAQLIGLSQGIVIGLHRIRIKYKLGLHFDKPVLKTYYQLVFPKTTRYARVENDKLIVRVRKNQTVKYRDPRIQLYDIQVEEDESFCVPMVSLHNCQIHKDGEKVRLFSRNLEETTPMFPEIVQGVLRQVKAKTAILDSEALAINPLSEEFLPFQETTKRRRKYGIEEMSKTLPLKAFIFDVMYIDGKSLMDQPLTERVESLESRVKALPAGRQGNEVLLPQPGEIVDNEERLNELFNDSLTKGLEGLVVKRSDSKYEAGARNFNWVKLKRHSAGELKDTIDCVILGYVYGRGKRVTFGAGALLVGIYDKEKDEFVTVSKIGTGLTDEEWREIKVKSEKFKVQSKPARVNSLIIPSVWVEPKIVIEVLADEITRSPVHTAGKIGDEPGYALRFPRLVKFREADRQPEDATTVKELIQMYHQQFKK